MAQDAMNIALPESVKEFVLQRVSEGGYSTASEYVSGLIRADQKQAAQQRLDALLIEGLEGGRPTPLDKKDWSDIRARVGERLKNCGRR